jgi:energy-coupling factor transporter ATP-binding protein EcfA2
MKQKSNSPWADRFEGLIKRDSIRARAEHLPDSIPELLTLPAHIATSKVRLTLEELLLLTDDEMDVVEKLVNRSYAYILQAYPTNEGYIRKLHEADLRTNSPPPICLTGLAGVGKTTLLNAFQRALPLPQDLHVGSVVVGGMVASQSYVRTRVDAGNNLADLLGPWLPQEYARRNVENLQNSDLSVEKPKSRLNISRLVPYAARYSYRVGLAASMVDEMQFLSQNSRANAQVTKFLLMINYIGVPFVFASNYSLCNKLLRRNQEDRDRLLSDIVVLKPMELNDAGLGKLLKAYDHILAGCVQGTLCEFIDDYSVMTLGIKRKVKELTIAAFEEMRACKDQKISQRHLKLAYKKRVSAVSRKDIELIQTQSISGRPTRSRADLWCPFGDEFNTLDLRASPLAIQKEQEISGTLLRQSLTSDQKKIVNTFEKADQLIDEGVEKECANRSDKGHRSRKSQLTAKGLMESTISHQKQTRKL